MTLNAHLLIKSILLVCSGAVLSAALGLLSSVFLLQNFCKKLQSLIAPAFLLILIPSFIHIQSWIFLGDSVTAWLHAVFHVEANFTGEGAYLMVFAFSNLPLNLGFALLGLAMIPLDVADLCFLEGGSFSLFWRVYLPALRPHLAIGALLTFILGIYDFTIASVFGINVFALELLAQFSYGIGLFKMFLLCLAPLLFTLGLLILMAYLLTRENFGTVSFSTGNPFGFCRIMRVLACGGGIVLGAFLLVPLFSLLYYAMSATAVLQILVNAAREFWNSLFLAGGAAFLVTFFGGIAAYLAFTKKLFAPAAAAALLFFVIPSPLLALTGIHLMNNRWLGIFYRSMGMPMVVMSLRYFFVGFVGMSLAFRSLHQDLLDAASLYCKGRYEQVFLYMGLFKHWIIAIFLMVFAFATGDYTIPILVSPGGMQTISVKIYNYLHYGASDVIAVLCLFLLGFYLLLIFAIQRLLQRGQGG